MTMASCEEMERRVLVTGATGYVGGRLVPRLLDAGYNVRCLVRSPAKLDDRPWAPHPNLEIVKSDLGESDRLAEQMQGCFAAYYLVHSMLAAGADYAEKDRDMAWTFARAAELANLHRIVYLGGLGELGERLSEHLQSRREVESALASTNVPVTVFRAAMIIGSGSVSFEILRYLVERLPIMVTPRWVATECQPIAIRNVIAYLVNCLRVPETIGRTLDIGGPDVLTYRELMRTLALERGLRARLIVPVPVLSPRLSSLWIHLVTPIDAKVARPLAEGLRNRVVCRNDDAHRLMPQQLLSVREAFNAALGKIAANDVETVWSSAGPMPGDPDWSGGTTFVDERSIDIAAPADAVFRAVCRFGADHDYYAANWLWRLRGTLDRLAGGPGLRRSRRDPRTISYGESLGFWRVIGFERDGRLLLRAEMKLPGEATLEFAIAPNLPMTNSAPEWQPVSSCRLTQTARFKPKGLLGLAYWYAVLPLHNIVFQGMLRGIRRVAEAK